jgi:hypothetical protein
VKFYKSKTHRELVYRTLQSNERCQQFIGTHDETLSVAAMRVRNPYHSASLAHTIAPESFLIAGR